MPISRQRFNPEDEGKEQTPSAVASTPPASAGAPPQFTEPAPKETRYLDDEVDIDESILPGSVVSVTLDEHGELVGLSPDAVMRNDYDTHYAKFEVPVQNAVTYLQDILKERGHSQDIAEARQDGTKQGKYQEVYQMLKSILFPYFASRRVVSTTDTGTVTALVINEILGLGPLETLWQDKSITEIMVNGPRDVRVEIAGQIKKVPGVKFRDEEHLTTMIQQMVAPLNRSFDTANALTDGRLPDGSRINATHTSVAPSGPFLTIRRFSDTIFTVRELLNRGSITDGIATEIGNLIHAGCSTIVSGGTGSGKTSALNAFSGCIPDDDRVITIEDTLELRMHPRKHVLSLETRKAASAEAKGNIDIRALVRNALRMRPDRIVVGEVRDEAAYDMLQAMNTGHEGSLTTVHANDAAATIERLSGLVSLAGEMTPTQARSLIASSVDLIVQLRRYEDGSRRVESISEVPSQFDFVDGEALLKPHTLWEYVQERTDEDGIIHGHYERVNEPTASLVKKHRLDRRTPLTLEKILEISDYSEEAATA